MNRRRTVIVELFDTIEIVAVLHHHDPDPSPAQLEAMAAVYVRDGGGVATCRVVEQVWFGWPRLTPAQQAALAGVTWP